MDMERKSTGLGLEKSGIKGCHFLQFSNIDVKRYILSSGYSLFFFSTK